MLFLEIGLNGTYRAKGAAGPNFHSRLVRLRTDQVPMAWRLRGGDLPGSARRNTAGSTLRNFRGLFVVVPQPSGPLPYGRSSGIPQVLPERFGTASGNERRTHPTHPQREEPQAARDLALCARLTSSASIPRRAGSSDDRPRFRWMRLDSRPRNRPR